MELTSKTIQINIVETTCPECLGGGEAYYKSYHNQLELEKCKKCKGQGIVKIEKSIDITEIFNNLSAKKTRIKPFEKTNIKTKHTHPEAHQYANSRNPINQKEYMMYATAFFDGMQKRE